MIRLLLALLVATLATFALPSEATAKFDPFGIGAARERRQTEADAKRIEAEARLAEARAAESLAAASHRASRSGGEESTKVERGLGTQLEMTFGADGKVTAMTFDTSGNSGADLAGVQRVEVMTNQAVEATINGTVQKLPLALIVRIDGVATSAISPSAAANVAVVAADAVGRASVATATGDAVAKIIAEGYRGRALVADTQGRVEVATIAARFDGYVKIWSAATGLVDVIAKRFTWTGAAGDVLESVVGQTRTGEEVTGSLVLPTPSPTLAPGPKPGPTP